MIFAYTLYQFWTRYIAISVFYICMFQALYYSNSRFLWRKLYVAIGLPICILKTAQVQSANSEKLPVDVTCWIFFLGNLTSTKESTIFTWQRYTKISCKTTPWLNFLIFTGGWFLLIGPKFVKESVFFQRKVWWWFRMESKAITWKHMEWKKGCHLSKGQQS